MSVAFADTSDMVANGGFESGSAGWGATLGTIEISDTIAYSGNKSACDTVDDSEYGFSCFQGFAYGLPVENISALTFRYLTTSFSGCSLSVYVVLDNPEDWQTIYSSNEVNTNGDWLLFDVRQNITYYYGTDHTIYAIGFYIQTPDSYSYIAVDAWTCVYELGVEVEYDSTLGFIDQVVKLLVPIILLVFPAWLFGIALGMGKWGFIIGLSVGAVLGRVLFSAYMPLWLVFLIAIGDLAMLYSSINNPN